jgi:hypothetical protein
LEDPVELLWPHSDVGLIIVLLELCHLGTFQCLKAGLESIIELEFIFFKMLEVQMPIEILLSFSHQGFPLLTFKLNPLTEVNVALASL